MFDVQAKHSTDGKPDEVEPVSLGVKPVMAEWIEAWDRAGRPPAMPRPYKVSEDPRLWRVKGGVAARTGAAAWLLNRDGMRRILQKYRREDGSFHLDDATCTEYEACASSARRSRMSADFTKRRRRSSSPRRTGRR